MGAAASDLPPTPGTEPLPSIHRLLLYEAGACLAALVLTLPFMGCSAPGGGGEHREEPAGVSLR